MDRENIKSVEKILTEGTGIDCRLQVAVRCNQHAHVDGERLAAPDAFKLSLLQHTKQGDLHLNGKVANLIEKNCSTVGRLKASNAPLQGPGEGAFLMAKKLRCNQRRRNSSTVHADECSRCTIRSFVNRTSNQFLSGSGFTRNEHGGISRSDFRDLRQHLA